MLKIDKTELEKLANQYTNKKLLAERLGMTEWKTRELLKSLGILADGRPQGNKNKSVPVPPKKELLELYQKQNMTLLDISKHYNTSNVTVKKWFTNYEIPLLSHSETVSKKVIPKIINSNMQKYGYEHFFASEEGKKKVADGFIKKYGVPYHPIGNTSDAELEVLAYFNSLVSGFEKNLKTGIEIDGYNDELKIGFEYCGLFWHMESIKGKNLHFKKYTHCRERGIRLITIFEDEWKNKPGQTKGFIRAILRKTENKVYARKLKIEKVDKRDYNTINFLIDNHIQGAPHVTNTLFHYILKDENDVIYSSMSFSKHHRNSKEIVLSRYCVKINHDVVGGSERLFKAAIKDFKCNIKTWSDNRWSEGAMYEKLGFKMTKELPKDYYYVGKKQRIPKQKMTKKKMVASQNQTEQERAKELGFDRIWDCGKKTWVFFYE
jgi:hypothetical protein